MPTILTHNSEIEKAAVDAIKTCFDPEIPVNIYELGLIYEITEKAGNVKVLMTLTSPNCPAAESLPGEVKTKVGELAGVLGTEVEVTFDPPWDKDMMSEEAKLELGFW